jgi:peptidyl-Asp metalloendopeptidase
MPIFRIALAAALALSVSLAADERRILLHTSFASEANAKKDRQPKPKRSRMIEPDFAALGDAPGLKKNEKKKLQKKLTAALFDDTVLHLELEDVERNAEDVHVWTGRIEGDETSSVSISVKDKAMVAAISTLTTRYMIEPSENGTHEAFELDLAAFPPESEPVSVGITANLVDTPVAINDSADFVDVLVVYTDDLRASLGSTAAAQAAASNAISASNTAYQNSGVTFRLRLAGTMEVAHNDDGNTNAALNAIRATSDGIMDDVHARRTQVGADIVELLVLNGGGGCGIAFTMQTVSTSFEVHAFGVIANSCSVGNLSFPHEVGHNFGLQHDRYVANNTPAYPYGYGYVDTSGQFRDIMAYANACGSCPRIQYFSSPLLSFLGRPLGVSHDSSPSTSADNVRALNNVAATIANFRQAVVVTPPPVPTFTDDPLVAGTTRVKAVHITELRTAVNSFRAAAGLGNATFTGATLSGARVKAIHIQELRDALAPARANLGLSAVTYTNPVLSSAVRVKAIHVQELRNAVK